MIEAVLFDLDGTFIDTAPDMGGALNNLLIEEGLPPLPLEDIRPYVSQGGLALTQLAFAQHVSASEIEPLWLRYLQHYRNTVADQSKLFSGCEKVLESLQKKQIKWGIVTNKPEWLTEPLLLKLGISSPVLICGDTFEHKKPHPLPLLKAAEILGVSCQNSIYVGDDERDVIAGKAAGMKTLIAGYGYIPSSVDLASWGADGVIWQPLDLLGHGLMATNKTTSATSV
ncbi:MAG: phosphoglycolate phosphatase [Gammaproteobacteria bacterium]|nr:phosphoglycolate phosphatase [Gammaproteobacteria bacterium]